MKVNTVLYSAMLEGTMRRIVFKPSFEFKETLQEVSILQVGDELRHLLPR